MSRQPVPEIPTITKEANALEPSLITGDDASNVLGRSHVFEANADFKMSEEGAENGVANLPGPLREEPVVSRRELWSYYLYYNGDNGVGPLSSTATIFQGLANAAGRDPTTGSSCTSTGPCVLPWGSGTKPVSSVVLVASGLSFAIMTLIFTTIGSAADYGNFGKYLLLVVTVICWAAQFATISLTKPDRWGVAFALYVIGYVSYGATLVFYAALFPRLARNTARSRALMKQYEEGEISTEMYELEESLEKQHQHGGHSTLGLRI